jgi:hypothetical protein
MEAMEVKVQGGILRATTTTDVEYPGIDVEFIADNEPENILSRPRVLIESPISDKGNIRALIWNDPRSEDYTEEIDVYNSGNATRPKEDWIPYLKSLRLTDEEIKQVLSVFIVDNINKEDIEISHIYENVEELAQNYLLAHSPKLEYSIRISVNLEKLGNRLIDLNSQFLLLSTDRIVEFKNEED